MGVPTHEPAAMPEDDPRSPNGPRPQSGTATDGNKQQEHVDHFCYTGKDDGTHTNNTQGHSPAATGPHYDVGAPSLFLPNNDVIPRTPPTVSDPLTPAGQECKEFATGASVDMWFMCRLFSSRRHHTSPPPASDPDHDHDHEQHQHQHQEEEKDVAVAADIDRQGGCAPRPQQKDVGGVSDSVGADRKNSGGVANREGVWQCGTMHMESSEEEEAIPHLAPHLDTRSAWGEDRGGGDSARGPHTQPAGDARQGHQNKDAGDDLHHHHHTDQAAASVQSSEDPDSNEGLKEQLAMVEAMVQDMKVSFMAALEHLSSLQEGDSSTTNTTNSAWQKMDSRCQRQDQQMSDLAKCLDSLRREVSSLSDSVQRVAHSQQCLQDQLSAVQSGQQLLLQELVSAGFLSTDKSREVLTKCRLPLQEGQFPADNTQSRSQSGSKVTDPTQGPPDQEKTDVTAAACKSLSLTQALAARCQDIDVSDSSEEDITSSQGSRQLGGDHHGQPVALNSAAAEPPERRQALQDIVDSEQDYCTQLWAVVHHYQQPLQDGHYMSSRQLCVLFPSPLPDLYTHHSHMLQALQDRMAHASYASAVGDVFARITDTNSNLLGLYQEYVESLPGAISCLRRQMSQSRSFRTFVKDQRDSTPHSDLLTLLLSPLQRIPKYMLQLQQVLRHTGEDHPDHFHLQACLVKLQDFVERFNHDITHTTHVTALDRQHLQTQGQTFRSSASNSSCEMLPPTTSTIDSGIQSTGEDTLPPPFLRSARPHHHYQWAEQTYHTDPRQAARMQAQRQGQGQGEEWRLTSHSQPDLTKGGYPHYRPCLHPTTTTSTTGDRSARQRRYKIKKRMEGQGQYGQASPLRPASAMDFGEGGEQEDRERRPHSVLGPFPGDRRPRVIQVYNRRAPRPLQHTHLAPRPSPHVGVNGHWDPAAGGDPLAHQGEKAAHYRPVVDYEDEEDDTRALSEAPPSTTRSHKASSQQVHHHPLGSETDNSDDFSQDDLAAALSLHLNNGDGGGGVLYHHLPPHAVSAQELRVSQQQMYSSSSSQPPTHHYHQHHRDDDDDDDDEDQMDDVHLDSTESDLSPSLHQPQKPPQHMSEELKLDLTCFHDDSDSKPRGVGGLLKRSQVSDPPPPPDPQGPLSMKPHGGGEGHSGAVAGVEEAVSVPVPADRSKTEPSKEVVHSLSGDKGLTSLPPIHPHDPPHHQDANGRLLQAELERPPVRRSVTPSEFSTVSRPAVLRRAATPSEFLTTPDTAASKGGRRRKDGKNSSSETLHRSVDDVSLSASKKKPFRTSLKNLFHRKKGSIILDELEREYTKELVRRCLVKNSHSPSTTTTLNNKNNNNNDVCTHSPQPGDRKQEGVEESEKKKNAVSPNNHHHNRPHSPSSLWTKMRKSPLFSLTRTSNTTIADLCDL
ncbi:uncharacterized protein LOC143296102 isoform X2 [Babylonia areolata]|uniref:uncharacterized protein LOC143296102 isoform X2 n=1 Tax=Babylonia areolata TaxID=304850 RepID=UPI003FD6726B